MPVQIANPQLNHLLNPFFQRRYEPNFAWGLAQSMYLGIPHLAGYWPMSVHERSTATDVTGNGVDATFAGSTSPPFSSELTSLVSWCEFDGTTDDFLSVPDGPKVDITGLEGEVVAARRGLTMGAWVWFDDDDVDRGIMGKGTASPQLAYRLHRNSSNNIVLSISGNGTTYITRTSGVTVSSGQWYFIVGRYTTTGTELFLKVNDEETLRTTGVPSSIFNSTSDFTLGRDSASLYLDGRLSQAFLCRGSVPDVALFVLYEYTRPMYGV